MVKRQAVVTGIGILTSGSSDRETFFQSIMNGKSGLRPQEKLRQLGVKSDVAGCISEPFPELEEEQRVVQLAYAALEEALQDSGLTKTDIEELGVRAGLSLSESAPGHIRTLAYMKQLQNGKLDSNRLIEIPSLLSSIVSYIGIRGQTFTTMSACAAGTAGAGIALDSIRYGRADVMIVVGAEALSDNYIAGFHSLQSMSLNGCVPFDKDRDGLSLGEGIAVFIVETLDRAKQRGAHIYGELLGYGLGNDAHHITSPDPEGEGAARTMRMALEDSGLQPCDIDYINAHGTATILNDIMEMRAISKVFHTEEERSSVMVSSTKAVTGHCLGAAGSVELAATLLAVDRGIVPPTASLKETQEQFQDFQILKDRAVNRPINYALSNSYAFFGNSATIVVGRVE
ncbi:beta-ketoacyl-[acyl-carrier-protein] synthase family protein [Paenibacillus pasadenensis]|uniref:beta-ketoacyl-[acyl-carrier-protein] synthase family protein n=1 Tax=Paenibacillus pasadenensis TaxID=217090 RepID=UPI0020418752|nr:beta-ketoacyl-[acyl-carrier-protein] synthase family protein [Paenibacillus pasadenensis]MCM3746414.1 beta-ketoacyl-[acyl-carrier-protein] synthase family protein [Paenibacillus pasadenensis]